MIRLIAGVEGYTALHSASFTSPGFCRRPVRMTPDRANAARELLAFYLEAGADALVGETPVNRFADPEPAAAAAGGAPESAARVAADARPPSRIRTTLPPKGVPAEQRPAAAAPPSPEAAVMAAR